MVMPWKLRRYLVDRRVQSLTYIKKEYETYEFWPKVSRGKKSFRFLDTRVYF